MIFVFLLTALIVFFYSAVTAGIIRLFTSKNTTGNNVKISVIIAAKNEEKNIAKVFASLKDQIYPAENFEVIFIDDNSTDKTIEVIKNKIAAFDNFFIYSAGDKKLPAKKGALQAGIEKSKYPFIMITDADCIIEKHWLAEFSKKFNEGFDFLFGISPLTNNEGFVSKLSSLENLRSSILSFSSAALNFPYSAAARSFGFNKDSFIKIGGYEKTTETLSGDDDLLIREAVKHKLKIGTVTATGAFVYSASKNTLSDYIKQKSRHTGTSLFYTAGRKLMLFCWHSVNILPVLLLPAALFDKLFLLPFMVKIFFDLLLIMAVQKKFGHNFGVISIIYFQIMYEIMLIINFIYSFFRKNKW